MKRGGGTINKAVFRALRKSFPSELQGITYEEWRNVLGAVNKKIKKQILEDPNGFEFPEFSGYHLGRIQIAKNKPTKPATDPKASKLAGKAVPYRNYHSFGYMYKIKWKPEKTRLNIYAFEPCRPFKKQLSEYIIEGKTKYHTFSKVETFYR
jgi:hypothetical protein